MKKSEATEKDIAGDKDTAEDKYAAEDKYTVRDKYAILKHSKSADLLRKSLFSHVWWVPSSKVVRACTIRLFDLLALISY